jgi:hypothetical protein
MQMAKSGNTSAVLVIASPAMAWHSITKWIATLGDARLAMTIQGGGVDANVPPYSLSLSAALQHGG